MYNYERRIRNLRNENIQLKQKISDYEKAFRLAQKIEKNFGKNNLEMIIEELKENK